MNPKSISITRLLRIERHAGLSQDQKPSTLGRSYVIFFIIRLEDGLELCASYRRKGHGILRLRHVESLIHSELLSLGIRDGAARGRWLSIFVANINWRILTCLLLITLFLLLFQFFGFLHDLGFNKLLLHCIVQVIQLLQEGVEVSALDLVILELRTQTRNRKYGFQRLQLSEDFLVTAASLLNDGILNHDLTLAELAELLKLFAQLLVFLLEIIVESALHVCVTLLGTFHLFLQLFNLGLQVVDTVEVVGASLYLFANHLVIGLLKLLLHL